MQVAGGQGEPARIWNEEHGFPCSESTSGLSPTYRNANYGVDFQASLGSSSFSHTSTSFLLQDGGCEEGRDPRWEAAV